MTDARQVAALRMLQDFGANIRGPEATELLVMAAFSAGAPVVRFLATLGANANGPDIDHMPLHRVRRISAAAALIDLGASLTARTRYPGLMAALHAAAENRCHPGVIHVMVRAGADIEVGDDLDATPLMHAVESAWEGDVTEKVITLLELGASPLEVMCNGRNAHALLMDRVTDRHEPFDYKPDDDLILASNVLTRARAWLRRRHMLLALRSRYHPRPLAVSSSKPSSGAGAV